MDGLAATLSRLGLTGYEARAYLALTRRGVATGAELARLAGLPRQRIYDVLEGLVERGFATMRAGRPLRYSAVAPAEAIGRLLEERRRELAEAETLASDAAERLAAAYEAGRDHTDPLGFIEVLREPRAIAARFAELQAAAQSEILVFTKPPYAETRRDRLAGTARSTRPDRDAPDPGPSARDHRARGRRRRGRRAHRLEQHRRGLVAGEERPSPAQLAAGGGALAPGRLLHAPR